MTAIRGAIGTCGLCRSGDIALQESHALPAWCHRRILGTGPAKDPVVISRGTAIQSSRQVTRPFLCASCEQLFGIPENYVSRLAARPDRSVPMLGHVVVPPDAGEAVHAVPARDLDWEKLFYFGLSLIWRADVMGHWVSLGDRYREKARAWLLRPTGHPLGIHVVLLAHIQDPSAASLDLMFSTPTQFRFHDCQIHQIPICGLEFWVVVGQRAHPDLEALCLLCSSTKHIVLAPARASGALQLLMKASARAETRGALARRKPDAG